jgi:hypothetical protein
MGLQDRYRALSGSPAAAPASAAPSTPPAATPTSAAPSGASGSSSPAAASPATTTPTPARRDLTALRQKLAGGNGGVNPPEAAAAVKDDMLDVTTKETPDGGAEPLPNHPDAAKLGVAQPATAPGCSPAPSADPAEAPAKRKRRTKAEMEAARAAEAASAPSPATAPSTAAGDESPVALAHGIGTPEYTRELAAAVAETEGHTILTDEVRAQLVADIRQDLLANLSLAGAIELVRERMFPGMKTLEIER